MHAITHRDPHASAMLIDGEHKGRLATEFDYSSTARQLRSEGILPTGDTKREFWDQMRSRLNAAGILTHSQINRSS